MMAIASLPLLWRQRKQFGFQAIDAHFAYPSGYAAVLLGRWFRVPVTITLRGTEQGHAHNPVLKGRVREALEGAARIFAVSASLKQLAANFGIAPDKIRVVGNGVDLQKFYQIPRAEACEFLGLPHGCRVLISVGGLVERKGFHRVIEILPKLIERHPGLKYVIVGGASPEGDFSQMLKAQVAALNLSDSVVFTGALPPDRLRFALSASDVFVLATRNEGWANVFLEAMACGLPVVATEVGGNAEVICRPELGTLVPFDDSQALAEAIGDALDRNWNTEAIRAYAGSQTWDQRVNLLVEEFNTLIDAPAPTDASRLHA